MKTKLLKRIRRKYWIIYDKEKTNQWFIMHYKTGRRTVYVHSWQFIMAYAQDNLSTMQWYKFLSKVFKRFDFWCDENGKPQIGEGVTTAYAEWLNLNRNLVPKN